MGAKKNNAVYSTILLLTFSVEIREYESTSTCVQLGIGHQVFLKYHLMVSLCPAQTNNNGRKAKGFQDRSAQGSAVHNLLVWKVCKLSGSYWDCSINGY